MFKVLRNLFFNGNNMVGSGIESGSCSKAMVSGGDSLVSRGINFTVYNAVGGKVVEFRYYDSVQDRSNTGLYIIRDDEDFSAQLGQIITVECLRNKR